MTNITKSNACDWLLRVIKGAVIGLEGVLPGISGAAMAVVFGLYERVVEFVANIRKNFVQNALFFLPVALGGVLGVYLISHPMSFLIENYKTPVLWFFVGAILGTMPELWEKSGRNGRQPRHIWIFVSTFILAALLLIFSIGQVLGQLTLSPSIAFGVGAVYAFTSFIPGFSSSNVWVMFGFYQQMNDSIKNLDFSILVPFVLGILLFAFPFSKGVEFLLKRTFTGFFHVILGFVLASVVLVIALASGWQQPEGYYNYMQLESIACLMTLFGGTAFSYWLCNVSKKYEKEKEK